MQLPDTSINSNELFLSYFSLCKLPYNNLNSDYSNVLTIIRINFFPKTILKFIN